MKATVIIPIYERDRQIERCIQSVLEQSYLPSEVVLVDLSDSGEFMKGFASRINHPVIRCMLPSTAGSAFSAVQEAIESSTGDFVCFLDGNDKFQKEKLQMITAFFIDHPSIQAVCHGHLLVSRSGKPLSVWRPSSRNRPESILLDDGLSLSDLAIRKTALMDLPLPWVDSFMSDEWIGVLGSLLLAGVSVSAIDRPLSECKAVDEFARVNPSAILEMRVRDWDAVFNDPHCPESALGLRDAVLGRIHLKFAYEAFVGGEAEAGRVALRESIHFDRSILDINAYRFFTFLILESLKDGGEHPIRLNRVFDELSPELKWMTPQQDKIISLAFVLKGARALLWGATAEGEDDLAEAIRRNCRIDPYFFVTLADELTGCEAVVGHERVDQAVDMLTPYLEKMCASSFVRWFKGEYFANRAFRDFEKARYAMALQSIRYAIFARPSFLINRGLLATGFRSLRRLRRQPV